MFMKDNVKNIKDLYDFISKPYIAYKNACKKYEEVVGGNDEISPIKEELRFEYLIQDINRISRIVKDDCENISIYLKEENKKVIEVDLRNKNEEYLVFITELLEEIDSIKETATVVYNLKNFIKSYNSAYWENKVMSALKFTLYEIRDYLEKLNKSLNIEFNDYITGGEKSIINSNFRFNIYDQHKNMQSIKKVISNQELHKISMLYDRGMNIVKKSFELLKYYPNINSIIEYKIRFQRLITLMESDIKDIKHSIEQIGKIADYLNGKVLISNYIDEIKMCICEELYSLYKICKEYYDNMQIYYIESVNKYFVKLSQVNKNMGDYEVMDYIENNQYKGDIEALMDEIIEENIEALKELAK